MLNNNIALLRPQDRAPLRTPTPPRYRVYTARNWRQMPQAASLSEEQRFAVDVVAAVLPFRVDAYVVDELIDWDRVPDDPLFRLSFPQREMLDPQDFDRIAGILRKPKTNREALQRAVREVRHKLNPHPAGQLELNRPRDENGEVINGLQHKYRETVLFFPKAGQVCHSYCTFCFRWAQFVGDQDLKMAVDDTSRLHGYLARHREVSDLLVTGGDPMVMSTRRLREYLGPLEDPHFDHVQTIRIGSKALSFWPQRFVTDDDADGLLRLFEQLARRGKHIALMAHLNHPNEMRTRIFETAVRRLRDAGVQIRTQAPLLANINDDADAWVRMWRKQVRLGLVPYYMFVERDTGARHYFEVPLHRAWNIYREAISQVSGLARTARGPSMSAGPGKVEIQGVTEINGEKVFVLRFIQGRSADWVQRPFFARYDENASWLDHLQPAFGEDRFFFEDEYAALSRPRHPIELN
ncbi:MAG: hypothetical protein PHP86_12915 [Nevskiales bacterium]|nr:hypothetical protein [Nevskiales bacterium]